tara:strand:- start:11359 stop:14730 length:3372 start_codon:yes stop_codon:yes gene_type:complete
MDVLTTFHQSCIEALCHPSHLLYHQFASYEWFMREALPHVLEEHQDLELDGHSFKLCNPTFMLPCVKESKSGTWQDVTPYSARKRKLTYANVLMMDVEHQFENNCTLYKDVHFCNIPTMVNSSFCRGNTTDLGGYFIIKGHEKTIVSQEMLKQNQLFVAKKTSGKFTIQGEIRSRHDLKFRSTSTMYIKVAKTTHQVVINLPFVERRPGALLDIPIQFLFTILEQDVNCNLMELICTTTDHTTHYHLWHTIHQAMYGQDCENLSVEDMIDWIGQHGTKEMTVQKRREIVHHILTHECLPHLGMNKSAQTRKCKVLYLGRVVRHLFLVATGHKPFDDRDDYENKRVLTPGYILINFFRQILRRFLHNIKNVLRRSMQGGSFRNVSDAFHAKSITAGLRFALATGNWSIQRGNQHQLLGVSQRTDRHTYPSYIGQMRKINTPGVNNEGKNPKPRQCYAKTWGLLCPTETPEGKPVGLVKNLAIGARVRLGLSSHLLIPFCQGLFVPLMECTWEQRSTLPPLFVNGVYLGHVPDQVECIKQLKLRRCAGDILADTSIFSKNDDEIHINSDAGCICRAVYNMEKLHGLDTNTLEKLEAMHPKHMWDWLLVRGVVQLLSKSEEMQPQHVVAMDFRDPECETATHAEIHASMFLSVCASQIPFSNMNQSPRNTYQSAMMKQASAMTTLEDEDRNDTSQQRLQYPEVPITSTMWQRQLVAPHCSSGQNCMVAILCQGENQEDSVILNRAAQERGLLRTVHFNTYSAENKNIKFESFEKPPPTSKGYKTANYGKLCKRGHVGLNGHVTQDDIIVGKVVKTSSLHSKSVRNPNISVDASITIKKLNPTPHILVNRVEVTTDNKGAQSMWVQVREQRQPIVGDKLSSTHGQKGTIGAVRNVEDMPFTSTGLVPDIILNPHAIPSRMTMGQIWEAMVGLVGAMEGQPQNATAFDKLRPEEVAAQLQKHGFDSQGNFTMYDGLTGRQMQCEVYMGLVYYQRLKHMVLDKMAARARGSINMKTGQPIEGRARQGGFRFGEMEKNSLVAHGAPYMLRDRLLDQSDPWMSDICTQCGHYAIAARPQSSQRMVRGKEAYCMHCHSSKHVTQVRIPRALKLLTHELGGVGIGFQYHFGAT